MRMSNMVRYELRNNGNDLSFEFIVRVNEDGTETRLTDRRIVDELNRLVARAKELEELLGESYLEIEDLKGYETD